MFGLLRKLIVIIVGVPIVVLGIILVPLPGPGLLIMFAGLFILSLEFDWAKKYVEQLRAKLSSIVQMARAKQTTGQANDSNSSSPHKTNR